MNVASGVSSVQYGLGWCMASRGVSCASGVRPRAAGAAQKFSMNVPMPAGTGPPLGGGALRIGVLAHAGIAADVKHHFPIEVRRQVTNEIGDVRAVRRRARTGRERLIAGPGESGRLDEARLVDDRTASSVHGGLLKDAIARKPDGSRQFRSRVECEDGPARYS